jgi:hypothetical protein
LRSSVAFEVVTPPENAAIERLGAKSGLNNESSDAQHLPGDLICPIG